MPFKSTFPQHCRVICGIVALLFSVNGVLSAQDTLYFNKNQERVQDTTQAEFIEIRKIDPKDTNNVVVMTSLKNGNTVSVLKYSNYSKNIFNGRCRYWYPAGGACRESFYANGVMQGAELSWYPSGALMSKTIWDKGRVLGRNYYKEEDGSIMTEAEWIAFDELDGTFPPRFPGGESALQGFLRANIHYPMDARENNIQGEVHLSFVVNKDGSISDIDVLQNPDQLLTNEAIRVVNTFPRWVPGTVGGVPVRVKFQLPIGFRLE